MRVQCPHCRAVNKYVVLVAYRYFYLCGCNACQRPFIKHKED